MPIATLRFKLPEESDEFATTLRAGAMTAAIEEVGNQVFRPARKHGYSDPEITRLLVACNGAGESLVLELERRYYEILTEYGAIQGGITMPIYRWKDSISGKQVEVVRSFEQWEMPPMHEEVADMDDIAFREAQWERLIGVPGVVKGHGWGGGKGNWIWLAVTPIAWASELLHIAYFG